MTSKFKINVSDIVKLRGETGIGVMDARRALEASKGNLRKAHAWLSKHAVGAAAKKADRRTGDGFIVSYIHQTGKVAAMVKLGCETDFVARTEDFQKLGKELAMQIASMNPEGIDELLTQEWIRDSKKTIKNLIEEHVAKMGENIKVLEIARMSF